MFVKLDSRFILILLCLLPNGWSADLRPCNNSDLVNIQCDVSETCRSIRGHTYCDCLPGHVRVNTTYCVLDKHLDDNPQTPKPSKFVNNESSDTSKSHLAQSILIPTLLIIIIVICSVYFIRKYKLISYIRNKISQRSIAYDEVMIGRNMDDDDPPLS